MRINEIFYSLQGEGAYTGTPAVFIRTSGCNLKCPFCDTKHQSGEEMSVGKIIERVNPYHCRHIVITGGEPSMQEDLEDLVGALHRLGKFVQVETNGTIKLPSNVDWVTCSPKEGGRLANQKIHEVKLVFQDRHSIELVDGTEALRYYLQPCDTGDKTKNQQIINECIGYIMTHPKWKLSLQTHKMLNIR